MRAVAFSHDGKLLASRSWDTTLRLWDPLGSRLLLTTFAKLTFGPRFDIDDTRLAICVDSETVQILEVARGAACGTLRGHTGPQNGPFNVHTSNDGRLLASVGTDGLRLWDMTVGLEVAHVPFAGDWPNMVIFHPRGDSLLLSAGTAIERWPLSREPTASGDVRRLGPPETILTVVGGAGRFAIDGAGRLLAFCRNQRPVVIELETRSEKPCSAVHPGLDTIALSTDARWIATGTWGGTGVRIWDAATGTLVRELPTDGSASVAFSPDGRWLVVSEPKRHRFHEVPSWNLVHAVGRANPGDLLGPVAFTQDGSLAAVADAPDAILLVDPPSGKGLIRLVAPVPHILNGLCFGPSGQHLAAATSGRIVQSWDLHRIRELLTALGIDWELAAFPPQPGPAWTAPLRIDVLPARRPGG